MQNLSLNPVWLDKAEYPFEAQFLKVKGGRMHYIDVGRGPTIVFVHGTPTWSFLFRDLIKELSKTHRCIAMDHLGFGLSDKPEKWSYKPEAHAENFAALMQHLNLKEVTLVVHDYGGPIALPWAIENPGKVARLVLMNTWLWSVKDDKRVQKVDKLLHGRLGKFLYLKLNVSPRFLMKKAFSDRSLLTRSIQKHYTSPFPSPSTRHGQLVFGQELVGSSDWFEKMWRQRESIENIPTLILWGMDDPFLGHDMLNRWHNFFKNQQMIRYTGVGHFVPEEQKGPLAASIFEFITGQYTPFKVEEEKILDSDTVVTLR